MMTSELSFLSWNLAMLERASGAPLDWTEEHSQAEIRDIVLAESPDLVLFQELPGVVPYVETHDMVRANPMSHSGNLATLIGHHLVDEQITHCTVSGCALLVTFVNRDLTVANVHLAPGAAGAEHRQAQLEAVIDASPTADLVVIGDTNTRTEEETALAAMGLSGTRPPRPTWNSKVNRFRVDQHRFVAYFSRYFATAGLTVQELRVLSDRAVTVDRSSFQLSDHYAFTGTVVTDG